MQMKMKTKAVAAGGNLLVIEPMGAGGELLLRAVRRQGFRSVVATTDVVYRNSHAPVADLIDDLLFVDFSRPDEAVTNLVRTNKTYAYEGVVVGWEFLTEVAAVVAFELGLVGPDPSLARARRNKLAMVTRWSECGAPVPRLQAVLTPDGVRPRGLHYPLVVKPAENSGSFGVSVVEDDSGLGQATSDAAAWTNETPHGMALDRSVLIQDYVPGEEFSVEAVSDRGLFFAWGVTKKFTTFGRGRAETGHVFPAAISDGLRDSILSVAERGARALAVTDGISHTEVKLDAHNRPTLIEMGPRPAGDFIPRLVELATGQSPVDVYVNQAAGHLPNGIAVSRARQAAGIQFFRPEVSGTLVSLDFPASLVGAEIVERRLTCQPGETVAPGMTNVERLGWAIVTADSSDEVVCALAELRDRTRICIL